MQSATRDVFGPCSIWRGPLLGSPVSTVTLPPVRGWVCAAYVYWSDREGCICRVEGGGGGGAVSRIDNPSVCRRERVREQYTHSRVLERDRSTRHL